MDGCKKERYLTSLDKASGSRFQSKNEYLLGRDPLVPGNSAGTVTACYLSSLGPNHDELDYKFLGNLSGDPYILHTNVCCSPRKENREQLFYLCIPPLPYSFLVDSTPIRVFNNRESIDVPFPNKQLMRIYSSLWSADDRATRGLVKTDWTKAPFHCLLQEL
ncbi:hypothetical protein AAG906_007242 [Vitis piasezkii]